MDKFIVTTMNDIPGYEIVEVFGEVFGLVCRARNVIANLTAGLRTLIGGEVPEYTRLLTDSRHHAIERLQEEARLKGANAVIAMRFDCNEIANLVSEVAAYGTAVTIRKKAG
ncbi:MAG: YbjQ family protein [Candidatus Binataceae bacterium]|nr:YbjQ family protein [Candidatus Binataceae bacterium]